MKQKVLWLMVLALGIALSSAPGLCDTKKSVHIGLAIPVTGPYSSYGKQLENGINLAVEEVNQSKGSDEASVELVIEDSRGIPETAKRAARKLTSDKRVLAVIGDFNSSSSMAARPVYQRAKTVQLSPTTTHPSFTPQNLYSFEIAGTQDRESEFMAKTAVETFGKKKIAVLFVNNDWGVFGRQTFSEEVEKLGGEIVASEGFFEQAADVSAAVEKVRSAGPEFLYICSMTPGGIRVLKQIHEIGWDDVIIMGARPMYLPQLIDGAGEAAENVLVGSIFFHGENRPEVQAFVKAYRQKYDQTPDMIAAIAYDAARLIITAIRNSSGDRESVRKALTEIKDFSGPTLKNASFTEDRHMTREFLILQVKDGDFVLYDH